LGYPPILVRVHKLATVHHHGHVFGRIQLLHRFINSFAQSRTAAMMPAGAVAVARLISRTVPLSEGVDAIANPARPGETRVLVVPE
jgi:hypothetical protein